MAFLPLPPLPFRPAMRGPSNRCRTRASVTPLADRVLIRIDTAADKSDGGLFLGSQDAKKQRSGTVVAVGTGRFSRQGTREEIALSVGDHVMWKDEYGSETVEQDGEELLALRAYSVVLKW